jgi:hypothetical protein
MPPATPATTADTDTRELAPTPRTGARPRSATPAHGDWVRRIAGLLRQALRTGIYDPSFERPDLIEDDYFRFRHQPRN